MAVCKDARLFCAAVLLALGASSGCGEGGSGANQDAGSGGTGGAGGPPSGACLNVKRSAPPRGPGGCCQSDTDCDSPGFCLGGWCSRNCAADGDCMPLAPPTPFPASTQMRCISEPMIGLLGFCWPGSAAPCNNVSLRCPPGEQCGVWFSASATGPPDGGAYANGLAARCIARYDNPVPKPVGESCDEDLLYECPAPVGLYHNCLAGMCTQGCDPSVAMSCPPSTECFGPLAASLRSSGTRYEGAGLCTGPSCGHIQFSNPPLPGDVRTAGSPTACGAGRYCAPFDFRDHQLDTMWLQCANIDPSGHPSGDSADTQCQQQRILGQSCQYTANCLQMPPLPDPIGSPCRSPDDCGTTLVCVTLQGTYVQSGALGTCSPPPPDGFCSTMCRRDSDCGTEFGGSPICLEVSAGRYPNGAGASLPYCFSHGQAFPFGEPPACTSESTCSQAPALPHTSCVPVSLRSSQAFCQSGVPGDLSGPPCVVPNQLCPPLADSLCLRASDGALHCTNLASARSEGAACDNGSECKSGNCWNRRARSVLNSPQTARCSAICHTTADCAPVMTCVALRASDNGTPTPDDDNVLGLCVTQVPESPSEQCRSDADCTGPIGHGNKCNTTSSACYLARAQIGDGCSNDADCNDGQTCFLGFPGGYCIQYGCDPGSSAAGNCPTGATCVPQGGGTGACLRSCITGLDCQRPSYICESTTHTCQP